MRRPLLGKIAAAFLVLVLALGVVYLTLNALTDAWVRISGSIKASFLRWWLVQSVHAQGTGGSAGLIFTTFDAPGAGTSVLQGTLPVSINATGIIAGVYIVAGPVKHGFVRDANGTITNFDAPDAGTGKNQGTLPVSINAAGAIAGDYFDKNNVYHGFVRAADGSITEFDVPGAGTLQFDRGTSPTSIDTGGISRDFIRRTRALCVTASFVPPMAPSRPLMFRVRARHSRRGPSPSASTWRGILREPTWTQAECLTASCVLPMAR